MNDIAELVDLPDPATQPLVHPLDLPAARRVFGMWWLVGTVANPAVGLCVAALAWFASQSYVVPLVAGFTLVGAGALVGHRLGEEAWAFIPRRRQDRERPLPISWDLASAMLFAALLAAVLVLAAARLGQADVAPDVRAFAFGSGAAAALLQAAAFAERLVRRSGPDRRATLLTLPAVVVVLVCVGVAYRLLFGPSEPVSFALMASGGALMVAMAALAALGRRVGFVQ
jgi:hypothetical protein